ncbi:hypothetical protein [Kutzneria sp. NPDC052558]|uniref:hypothetical protein n=1 Tax=Kutzneria sp. NPDC052558 TaxID=3364121 RepID=UPI0037C5D939
MSETVDPHRDDAASDGAQSGHLRDIWTQPPTFGQQHHAELPHSDNGFAAYIEPDVVIDPKQIRIGLWGSPRSGKTTYLAALRVAALDAVGGYDWVVSGRNRASQEFIIDKVNQLVDKLEFPPPTLGVNELAWNFHGNRESRAGNWFARLIERMTANGSGDPDMDFEVHLQDAAGETYGDKALREHFDSMMRHLMHAHGIVYLFDPIGNSQEDVTSFKFFFSTLEHLSARMRDEGMLERGLLPQDVSVCVTKFDDPGVLKAAMQAGVVYQENEGAIPRVPPEIAADFLASICVDDRSRLVLNSLKKYFQKDRIRYFATSSIGFHVDPKRGFDFDDLTNVDTTDGVPKLRSAPNPINTLEPIISLAQRIQRRLETR